MAILLAVGETKWWTCKRRAFAFVHVVFVWFAVPSLHNLMHLPTATCATVRRQSGLGSPFSNWWRDLRIGSYAYYFKFLQAAFSIISCVIFISSQSFLQTLRMEVRNSVAYLDCQVKQTLKIPQKCLLTRAHGKSSGQNPFSTRLYDLRGKSKF